MANENKIQIVVEAYNMAQSTLDALGKQIKGIGDETAKTGQTSKGMLAGLKENWLAVTAAVAGAAVIFDQALELLSRSSKAQQAEESFRSVAAAAGESSDEILAAMKKASNGTVDDSDIMQKAVKGMIQGLSGDQLVQIMEAARVSARTTGEDVGSAFETITDAIANQMPRALVKYGLVTKQQLSDFNDAVSKGATGIDLYAVAMSNANRQQAMMGEVTENNAEKIQQLSAWWSDAKETIGGIIWGLISGTKSLVLGTVDVVMGLMSGAVTGLVGLFLLAQTGLNKIGAVSDETLAKTQADFDKLKSMTKDFFGKAVGADKNTSGTGSAAGGGSGSVPAPLNIVAPQMYGPDRGALKAWEEAQELMKKDYDEYVRATEAAIEYRKALQELTGTFGEGFDQGMIDYLSSVKTAFQEGEEMADQTARAMESSFSDLFFDAIKGELKSLSDYVTSFLQMIGQQIANMMAQKAAAGIIGSFNWGSSVSAGSSVTGYEPGSVDGSMFHFGGVVRHQGGYIPRFHVGGLNSDERMTINKVGERYITEEQNSWLTKIADSAQGGGKVSLTMNVDNQTGSQVAAKSSGVKFDGEKYIVSVVLKNVDGFGALYHALKGK